MGGCDKRLATHQYKTQLSMSVTPRGPFHQVCKKALYKATNMRHLKNSSFPVFLLKNE